MSVRVHSEYNPLNSGALVASFLEISFGTLLAHAQSGPSHLKRTGPGKNTTLQGDLFGIGK